MPFIYEPISEIGYFLLSCDKNADEIEDLDGDENKLSHRIIRELISSKEITDIFILCHGWLVDQVSAKQMYNEWIQCFYKLHLDKKKEIKVQKFKPMIIAIHWPSRPMSQNIENESTETIEWLANLIAEIPEYMRRSGRSAIELTHELLINLANKKQSPQDLLFSAVYLTSYFRVKAQAEEMGTKFISQLLSSLDKSTSAAIHCIGHSFGVLALAAGLVTMKTRNPQFSVSSLYCIQGALSLWSFCLDLPGAKLQPGKFGDLVARDIIRKTFLITFSRHDKALGWAYPNAMKILDKERWHVKSVYPSYGALGAHGARGYGIKSIDMKMLSADKKYHFQPGLIYNLDAEQFIKSDTNTGGDAHNNIVLKEVANALWHAVFSLDTKYSA